MQLKLLSVRPETASVTSFYFEKPADFEYKAGQFINITVPHENPDNRGMNRNYSLASSPTEKLLMISTKHGVSTFKQTLQNAKPGFIADFKGPFGKFLLNEDLNQDVVMIAGGIGITPFHAIIKYATEQKLEKKITLLYSNKYADDIPFYTELEELVTKNPHLTIHYTITQPIGDNPDIIWHGRTGRITGDVVKELIPNWQTVEFMSVGPALMVLDMKKQLKTMGVADEHTHIELFTGY